MVCLTDVVSPNWPISPLAPADGGGQSLRNQDPHFPSLIFNDSINLRAGCRAQQGWLLETQQPQRSFLGDSTAYCWQCAGALREIINK